MTILRTADAEYVTDANPLPVKLPDPVAVADYTTVTLVAQAITATTPVLVATPVQGRRWRLLAYHIGSNAIASVLFKVGAAKVEKLRTGLMAANATVNSPPGLEVVGVPLGIGSDTLWLDVSATATLHGFLLLRDEPA